MDTNDTEQRTAQSTPESDGGSSAGEGRGRRRRRRGRRGEGRGEGRPQDGATPNEGGADDADDRDDATAPGTSGAAPAAGARPEGDPDRKKKRRKKKSGERSADAPDSAQGGERENQNQNQNQKQKDRKEPEKKERAPRGSVLQRRVNRGEFNDAPKVKDEPIAPPPPVNAVNVEGYVNHHKGWQREVLATLRNIVKAAGGEIEESILWSQPVFTLNGPVCYMKAFSDHVNFGFWRGTELDDPNGLLVGDLTKMRHITIRNVNDIKRDVFEAMVRQAVRLNREKGDPTLS